MQRPRAVGEAHTVRGKGQTYRSIEIRRPDPCFGAAVPDHRVLPKVCAREVAVPAWAKRHEDLRRVKDARCALEDGVIRPTRGHVGGVKGQHPRTVLWPPAKEPDLGLVAEAAHTRTHSVPAVKQCAA